MQTRTDSRGKLNIKNISKPVKPYNFKSNSRGPTSKPLERKDYLREFKNSLNSILASYQNKKSAQIIEQSNQNAAQRISGLPRQQSTQTVHNLSQKAFERETATNEASFAPLPKKKSRSTASLKTGTGGIFENYLKRPLNVIPNGNNKPLTKQEPSLSKPSELAQKNRANSRGSQRNKSLGQKFVPSATNGLLREAPVRQEENLTRPNFFKAIKPKPLVPSRSIGKLVNIYNKPPSLPKKTTADQIASPKDASPKAEGKDSGDLKNFVTNISESKLVVNLDNPLPPQRAFSQKQLNKPVSVTRPYFFDDLIAAHTISKSDNYFHSLFKIHMSQTIQSMMVLSKVNLKEYNPNGKESVIANSVCKPKQVCGIRPVSPPSSAPKKTLIFDLDETLIHCNEDQSGPADLRVPVVFPSGEKIMAGINIRPFAKEVLESLAQHFEIIIFTASHSCYANPVIDYFDEKMIISGRLFRENCSMIADGLYTKDLRVIKNRDLKDLVLVDNAVYSFILNLENGIPIIPFYNNKKDTELLKLKEFLLTMKEVEDVRPHILNYFEWETFLRHGTQPDKLFKKLFE